MDPAAARPALSKGQRRLLLAMVILGAVYPALVLSELIFPESNAWAGLAMALPAVVLVYFALYLVFKIGTSIADRNWRGIVFPITAVVVAFLAACMSMVAYTRGDEWTKGVAERAGARLEASNYTAARLKELITEEAMRSRHSRSILNRVSVVEAEGKPRVRVFLSLLMTGFYDPASRQWTYRD